MAIRWTEEDVVKAFDNAMNPQPLSAAGTTTVPVISDPMARLMQLARERKQMMMSQPTIHGEQGRTMPVNEVQ